MPPALHSNPLHATAVSYFGRALLIFGESGQGKSSLALALIEQHGFMLVGDDRVLAEPVGIGNLQVSPVPALAGLLEVRGLGIMRMPYRRQATVVAALSLDPPYPRMPDVPLMYTINGISVPLHPLDPQGPALACRAALALRSSIIAHNPK